MCVRERARACTPPLAAKAFVIQEGCGSASDLLLVLFSACVKGPCALYLVLVWTAAQQRDGSSAGDQSLSCQLAQGQQHEICCRLLGRVEHRLLIFRCRYKTHTLHIPVFLFYCVYLFARMDGRRPGRKTVGTERFYFPHVTFENAFRTGSSGCKCEVLTTSRTFFPAASCRISVAWQVTHKQKTQTTQNETTQSCVISLHITKQHVERTWCHYFSCYIIITTFLSVETSLWLLHTNECCCYCRVRYAIDLICFKCAASKPGLFDCCWSSTSCFSS